MASNYTENYGLCQWEATDQVLRTEFNEDNAKVDAALQGLTETVGTISVQIKKAGNCQIYTTTYTGTGRSGEGSPNQLTFPAQPWLLAIISKNTGSIMIAVNGQPTSWSRQTGAAWNNFTWSGNTVSWYGNDSESQMNDRNTQHVVVAFLQAG